MKRATCLLVGLLVLAAAAHAQAQDRKRSLSFVGFSGDAKYFLVKQYDPDTGLAFMVYDTNDGTAVKRIDYQPKDEQKLLPKVKRQYGVKDDATVLGQTSPDGKFTIMGAQDGKLFEVFAMAKPRIGKLGETTVKESDGKLATTMMKECAWTADGKLFVVILNHKVNGPNILDYDVGVPFRFSKFKIQWMYAD